MGSSSPVVVPAAPRLAPGLSPSDLEALLQSAQRADAGLQLRGLLVSLELSCDGKTLAPEYVVTPLVDARHHLEAWSLAEE